MKNRRLLNMLVLGVLTITPPLCAVAQNDAFFSESVVLQDRSGSDGLSFDGYPNSAGLGFGGFNDYLDGLGFDGYGDDGLSFSGFGEEGEVPLGGGLLLLSGFAGAWLAKVRSQRSKDKRESIRS